MEWTVRRGEESFDLTLTPRTMEGQGRQGRDCS